MKVMERRANKMIDKPMAESWQMLIELMPDNDWNITKAAVATGAFSESYIEKQLAQVVRRDPRFVKALKAKMAEIQAIEGFTPDRIKLEYVRQYRKADEKQDLGNARGLLADLAKINGMMIDRQINIDVPIEPLKPGERELLSQLSKRYLASKFSENPIIDAETEETDK